jgi:hypothetical protein
VSDLEAEDFVQLAHKRLWLSKAKLRAMMESGELVGPVLSDEQWSIVELGSVSERWRNLQRKKSSRRHSGRPPRKLGILEEVVVDIVGPRRLPSLRFRGVRGNHRAGGNRYIVVFVDRATKRVFLAFITRKNDLEAVVRTMRKHMEMEARESIEYSGKRIRVRKFISDRDSDMTSDEAVADMIDRSIKHEMTAADARNQTPLLDATVRRLLDMIRICLDTAGLGPEYWEFAGRHAETLLNLTPQDEHELKHSAARRWTGQTLDLDDLRTFGADVYPHQNVRERKDQDKINPVAPGGDGRYRYVGIDHGPGFASNGVRVLDTTTGLVRALMNVEINEKMTDVRRLPKPVRAWADPTNEVWGRASSPEEEEHDDDERNELEPLPCSPPGILETIDELDEESDSDDSENEDDRPEETHPGRPPKPRARRGQRKSARIRKQEKADRWADDTRIVYMQRNPKTIGKKCHSQYDAYKSATTVREFLKKGGTRKALRWDRDRGFVMRREHDGEARIAEREEELVRRFLVHKEIRHQRARKAYAAHVATFTEARRMDMKAPKHLPNYMKEMPFWEAAASAESDLDDGLAAVAAYVHEAALWLSEAREHPDLQRSLEKLQGMAFEAYCTTGCEFEANVIEELAHLRASEVPTPKTYREAMSGRFAKYWKEALDAEWKNVRDHGVYEWVPKPPGVHLIDSNYAWKCKADRQGQISKFKCRVVARGFRQIYGIHFHHSMAPVGKTQTFRVLLAEAAHRAMDIKLIDVSSAYLCADIDVVNYMTPPKGVDPPEDGQVMKLVKPLYGTRNGAFCWHKAFEADLLSWGYQKSSADPCLFTKRKGNSFIRILLFVDDLAIFTDRDAEGKQLQAELITHVGAKYKFSSGHDDNVYLGMAITRVSPTKIFLSQERYIEDVMLKYGFNECRRQIRPSPGGRVSVVDCFEGDPKDNPHLRRFREMCGVLRWIEQCTRPDLSATLSELCKVQCNPGESHMKRMEHLMKYVGSTRSLGLLFGRPAGKHASGPVVGLCDSDWAGDPDSAYSRGGYIFESWGTPVSWASFKMKAVAASSAESEYMAMSITTREAIWLRLLFADMGYGDLSATTYGSLCDADYRRVRLSKTVDPFETAMMIQGDNKAALQTAKNPVNHKRMKHVHIAFGLTREAVKAKFVAPTYISTVDNTSDIMTKELGTTLHRKHTSRMLADYREGKFFDLSGKELDVPDKEPSMDVLYVQPAPGLGKSSQSAVSKLLQVCSDLKLIQSVVEPDVTSSTDEVRPKIKLARRSPLKRRQVTWAQPSATNMPTNKVRALAIGTRTGIAAAVTEVTNEVLKMMAADLAGELSRLKCHWQAAGAWESKCIVDSGASFTYATDHVPLTNVRPGRGCVTVATGKRESVAEIGDLGALRNVRRVRSFTRTLVGVRDLVDQFHEVRFNRDGVHVVSKDGHVATKIGDPTRNRLYSFDGSALSKHARRLGGG